MKAKITLNKNWSQDELNKLDKGIFEVSLAIHDRATFLAPHMTGALRDSGRVTRLGAMMYAIRYGSDRVPYAKIQHDGGIIRPKNKPMLAWQKNGQWIFAKQVTIRGTKYLEKGRDSVMRGDLKKYFR